MLIPLQLKQVHVISWSTSSIDTLIVIIISVWLLCSRWGEGVTFSKIHRKQLYITSLGRPIRPLRHYIYKETFIRATHDVHCACTRPFFRKKKKREKENKYGVLRTRHCYSSSYTVSPPLPPRSFWHGIKIRVLLNVILFRRFSRARGDDIRFFRDVGTYIMYYCAALQQYCMQANVRGYLLAYILSMFVIYSFYNVL